MHLDDDRILLAVRALIALLVGAGLLLIMVILSGSELDETSGKGLGTAVAFAVYSLTAMAGVTLAARRPDAALFAYMVAGVSALAFLAATVAIWSEPDSGGWELPGILFVLALGGGHGALLLKGAREGDAEAVRAIRLLVLIAIAALCLMAAIEISAHGSDMDPRLLGVTAVLYLLGTALLPLVRRTSSPAPPTGRSATELLRENGHVLVEGPTARGGVHGSGHNVCLREPDGTLIEVITYKPPATSGSPEAPPGVQPS